jgi:transcriptional regulator with XRE-family HTH domain
LTFVADGYSFPRIVTKTTGQRRLVAWLKTSRQSQRALAREIQVSPGYVTHLIKGVRTPSLRVAKRLQDLTGIPATDFTPPSA